MADAFNQRLDEYSQQPDCPFISANAGYDAYLVSKTADAFAMMLMPKPGQDTEAVKAR